MSDEPYSVGPEYSTSDMFTFVNELQSLHMNGKFMVSFDVESLYTNS